MKKIVFFDIDGTLLDDEKNLPGSTKEAIKTLQENGIYTALATGRAPFMVTSLLKDLNIESFVCFNGQYVVFGNEVVYTNPLDSIEIKKLIDRANTNNHHLVFLNESTLKSNVKFNQRVKESFESLQMVHPEYDPDFYEKTNIYQSLLFAREGEDSYLTEFEDNLTFIRWHEESLDVVPKGGSKAEGIKKLIERLGFEMENVYAFGDGLNDIEMLQTVGTGIAMGNAHEAVKMHADLITTNVDDNGIVNGLVKVGLLEENFERIK
ncbi:Cof-type HAD-IIB family hydrolase [Bacillus sp. FJAT-49732]|uniref:Cof-type HAD-IIB family hydrolase n=1 Tax=Lederbergia citrisecunda TaxID=2833583 RepID=A0A942YKP6_9BACI|nr:Cof-type HAD-IIB family hydrolase [Lederbergia citrisecunda]MBS4198800.1 Cof-type HAD-IIB family hydrolase [Lederbergia citrisecunda]